MGKQRNELVQAVREFSLDVSEEIEDFLALATVPPSKDVVTAYLDSLGDRLDAILYPVQVTVGTVAEDAETDKWVWRA